MKYINHLMGHLSWDHRLDGLDLPQLCKLWFRACLDYILVKFYFFGYNCLLFLFKKQNCLFFFSCLQFNGFLNAIFFSPPAVGLIVSVFLDNTLEVEKSKKDRGMPWWVKFRTFRGDNRNEEFYTLPFNLNKFFPPT